MQFSGRALLHRLDGLVPFTHYRFRVEAMNSIGAAISDWSSTLTTLQGGKMIRVTPAVYPVGEIKCLYDYLTELCSVVNYLPANSSFVKLVLKRPSKTLPEK